MSHNKRKGLLNISLSNYIYYSYIIIEDLNFTPVKLDTVFFQITACACLGWGSTEETSYMSKKHLRILTLFCQYHSLLLSPKRVFPSSPAITTLHQKQKAQNLLQNDCSPIPHTATHPGFAPFLL